MQYYSLYSFYWFGTCLRYLQDVREGNFVHGDGYVLTNIEGLFKKIDELQLNVTSRHAHVLLELPTAAAFHILRATEDVLRHYYTRMVRNNRIAGLMWGPIVANLRTRHLTKRHETLNNHLDNIRVSFRNPTQHPESMYDIHEVQDLWGVCIDVVNRMVRILRDSNRI
jgi:hypothetical protein